MPKGADGKILCGGWFCVDHRNDMLRLIYDRRPVNATEASLNWLDLPAGQQLTRLVIDRGETIRGSGDDMESWFFQLQHQDDWHRHNGVGRRLLGKDFVDCGGIVGNRYRLVMRVVGMGDHNGVAFAQNTLEGILRSGGALKAESLLKFSRPIPQDKLWQVVYVDDHNLLYVLPRHRLNCFP